MVIPSLLPLFLFLHSQCWKCCLNRYICLSCELDLKPPRASDFQRLYWIQWGLGYDGTVSWKNPFQCHELSEKKEERSLRAHYAFFLPSDRVSKCRGPFSPGCTDQDLWGQTQFGCYRIVQKLSESAKHRNTEWLRWEGTSGDDLVQPTYSSTASCPGICPHGCWGPPRMETPQPPQANCVSSWSPAQWKIVSWISVYVHYLWSWNCAQNPFKNLEETWVLELEHWHACS